MEYEKFVDQLIAEILSAEKQFGLLYTKRLVYDAIEGDPKKVEEWAMILSMLELKSQEDRKRFLEKAVAANRANVIARIALTRLAQDSRSAE
jgi:hypothetical protein